MTIDFFELYRYPYGHCRMQINALSNYIYTLHVTCLIRTSGQQVQPKSGGIGSTKSMIHLLNMRNCNEINILNCFDLYYTTTVNTYTNGRILVCEYHTCLKVPIFIDILHTIILHTTYDTSDYFAAIKAFQFQHSQYSTI